MHGHACKNNQNLHEISSIGASDRYNFFCQTIKYIRFYNLNQIYYNIMQKKR